MDADRTYERGRRPRTHRPRTHRPPHLPGRRSTPARRPLASLRPAAPARRGAGRTRSPPRGRWAGPGGPSRACRRLRRSSASWRRPHTCLRAWTAPRVRAAEDRSGLAALGTGRGRSSPARWTLRRGEPAHGFPGGSQRGRTREADGSGAPRLRAGPAGTSAPRAGVTLGCSVARFPHYKMGLRLST